MYTATALGYLPLGESYLLTFKNALLGKWP